MTTTTYAIAVQPRDFSQSTRDPNRDRWQAGALAAVVEILDGQLVSIVADTQTGHTMQNVVLKGVRPGRMVGFDLVIESTYEQDGKTHTQATAFPVFMIGTITAPSNVKWDAIRLVSDRARQAITKVRNANLDHDYGKWTATPGVPGAMDVTYEPQRENAGGRLFERVAI